ncbi:MAG: hypothetical protein ABIQ40_07545, partial [Bacteroidia bacterium]
GGIKPAETYPPIRIKACDDALAGAAKDKQYTDAIADADAKFAAKDYTGARAKYVEAGGIKPAEQYPKDKIKACDDALAGAAKDKLYNDAIAAADLKFTAKDYTGARAKYLEASGIKATEQYPKDRIKACDDAMGAAAKEKSYTDAITAADAEFAASDWAGAKAKYVEASGIKPAEQYPKDKIKACEDALAAAGKEKQYADLIKSADVKFTAKEWAGAKAIYQQASDLKTAEQYPKDKIKACDDAITAAGLDKQYTDLIKSADVKFTAKDYSGAKTIYQQASALKAEEQYPKDRIKACDDGMGAAAIDAQYQDLVKQADAKFTTKDFSGAKGIYQQASDVKPTEQYPKDKIKACDDELAKDVKNKAYNDLITSADAKFTAADWQGAKDIYLQASAMKPAEVYPKDKIKACDDKMAGAAKDKLYTEAISEADKKFEAKDWVNAKAQYGVAAGIKPTEQYPKDKMKACDTAIANEAKDKAYTDAIAAADVKFDAKDFTGARIKYSEASGLKPAEQYPKDRIKLCDDQMGAAAKEKAYTDAIAAADLKFTAKDFTGAKIKYSEASGLKPSEQYPKDRMKACDDELAAAGLEKQYADLIKSADAKFVAKAFADAKTIYQQASALKTEEQYPKDKIKACDDALGAAAIDAQYKDLVKQADAKFTAKDFTGAKDIYSQASGVKPAEQYPKDKIKACDDELAKDVKNKAYNDLITSADAKFTASDWQGAKDIYQQASAMKPAEVYPKDKIKACDDKMAGAAKDKLYTEAIAEADKKFEAKDWVNAKAQYGVASGIKPSEQYPKDKMKACDAAIAGEAKDKNYADAIAAADTKFDAKDFTGARTKYAEASGFKPTEQYPKDRIKLCDDQMGAAAKEKAYADAITAADAKFTANDWAAAKTKYTEASGLKPTEQYPKDRIKLCDDNIAQAGVASKYSELIKQGEEAFELKNWAVAKGFFVQASAVLPTEQYPKDRIKICDDNLATAGIDKQYNDLIKSADAKFALKDWNGAKSVYVQASGVKPAEQYPKDKIKACDDALANAKDKAYNDVIAAADAKFTASDWIGAKAKYNEALGMRSAELYPKEQITICDANLAAAGTDKQYATIITAADALFTGKNWEDAKAKYQEALGVKPAEAYPKDRIKACDENINASLSLDGKYRQAIARGDSAMAKNDLESAQSAFTTARDLKTAEAYPKQKLDEISKLLAANSKDRAYRALIATGDSLFALQNYTEAKKVFTTATTQKPADQYPKDKLAEIKRLLDDQKFATEKQKKYDLLMAQADKKFEAKDYKGAKAIYSQALVEKPFELLPKTQIQKCDDALNPKTVVVKDPTNPVNKDEYISELVKKYPLGVTSSSSTEEGTVIESKIVIVGNKGWKYQKKIYNFGTYYFKDGVQISEQTYNYETSLPYVQQQQAEYDKNQK